MKKAICDFCGKEDKSVEKRVMPMYFLSKDKNKKTVLVKNQAIKERNICSNCKMKIFKAFEKYNKNMEK